MSGADFSEQSDLAGSAVALATATTDASWHESVYAEARGDAGAIPWAHGRPCPCLINWLNARGPAMIRPGGRVAVVGCGLGDDAAALAARGYDVVAFDASPTAVEWARRRFPKLSGSFLCADLFDLPGRMKHRFDLVAEAYTLESIEPSQREEAVSAICSIAAPHGVILVIARARREGMADEVAGPPWPLSAAELEQCFARNGWRPSDRISEFDDDGEPPVRRLRCAFVHESAAQR